MKLRTIVLLVALAAALPAMAAPPVTSPQAASPAAELAARWVQAIYQAPWIDLAGSQSPRSEALRMLLAVQRDEKLAPGVGWYGPASRRYDWNWFASRFDSNGDGRVTPGEFHGPKEFFKKLDRDGDRAVTAADFDWSDRSPWVKQDSQALRLFREIDQDGDGHVTDQEWLAFMKAKAGEKGHLTPEDLRTILAGERPAPGKGGRRVSRDVWLESLMAGDLGSAFEGPRADRMAPDFTLPRQNGKGTVTLSELRGKPVVLIFGSFT